MSLRTLFGPTGAATVVLCSAGCTTLLGVGDVPPVADASADATGSSTSAGPADAGFDSGDAATLESGDAASEAGDGTFASGDASDASDGAAPIDACAVHNGGCDAHAICTDTETGTSTCTCQTGYSGTGYVCAAINPCLTNNGGCDTGATCTMTRPGTNTCACLTGSPCNGACLPLADGNNCGACGHNCGGGQCAANAAGIFACQPVTLASNQFSPFAIAVDPSDTYVVWIEDEESPDDDEAPVAGVLKTPVAGGAITALANWGIYSDHRDGLAVDSTTAYYSNNGNLEKVPLAGGPSTPTQAGGEYLQAVSLDANNVYFTTFGVPDQVGSVAKTGTALLWSTTLPNAPDSIVAAGGNLYFYSDGAILMMPVTGGTPRTFATPSSDAVAADETNLYLLSASSVQKVPLAGGSVTTLATGIAGMTGLAVDSTGVYTYGSTITKVPLAGGTPTTIVTGVAPAGAFGIALDATSVYWLDESASTVSKIAKP